MVQRELEMLDELDAARAADAAELTRYKASVQVLAEFSSFLIDLIINSKAFSSLPEAFQSSIGSSQPFPTKLPQLVSPRESP